jgi:RNA recognition motif-containing protein
VFVANLDTRVTWKILKDNMQSAGEVVRVNVITNSRGESKGCAIVIYASSLEKMAIQQMHEVKLLGRPMPCEKTSLPSSDHHAQGLLVNRGVIRA